MTSLNALESGTELAGDYRLDRVLGAGGFGVTYLAHEIALSRLVTIKEYFPGDFARRIGTTDAGPRSQGCASDYNWGLDRFIEEAQTLAKFDHPNIVRVYRTFRANNTAYMVLTFEEGKSLKLWLKELGRAPRQKELDRIIGPLLDALETIHKADFLHRDIAPDNIIIRKSGEPVLIDFGAARGDIAAHSKTKTVSALVKPGYSPYEQYAENSRQQGPWTDIYALAATLYHAIAGKRPPDSPSRMLKDEFVPASEAALSSYRGSFLRAIDNGLALGIDQRPQSIAAWRGPLLAPEPRKPGLFSRITDEPTARKTSRTRAGKAVAGAVTSVPIPPPPDAPGPAGRMLDFVDALQPAKVAAPAKAGVAEPANKKTAKAAAPAKFKDQAKFKDPAKSKDQAPAPDIARWWQRARKRPRPAPDVARPRRWTKGLARKLAVAAALATILFATRDKLAIVLREPQTSGITTGALAPQPERTLSTIARFKTGKGPIEAVRLSGDGRLIVTTSDDQVLRIWNRESRTEAGAIFMDDGPATSLGVRNNRAVTTHADGSTNIWDLDKKQRVSRFKRNEASVWSADFVGSEDRIASAGHDWTVAIWETASETAPARLLEGHESAVQALASDPSGTWLASGGADKVVKLWNLQTLDLKRTYRHNSDFVTALAVSSDASLIASGSLDGAVRLWSTSSNRALRTYNAHKARVTAIAISANGEYLASAAEDGSVRVRGLKQSRLYWTLSSLESGARALTFDADGRQLITGGQDGAVTLWSMPEPALAQR